MSTSSRQIRDGRGTGGSESSTLIPLEEGRFRLELTGKFPPRWLANLTSNLAAREISILRGEAKKQTPTLWRADFELAPGDRSALPEPGDFLPMTLSEQFTPRAPQIRLMRYELALCEEGLRADVEGPDSVGFLVGLFNRFTFFSLFPLEIAIDTPGGRIRDRFWLRGIGGTLPTEECRDALDRELAKLVAA